MISFERALAMHGSQSSDLDEQLVVEALYGLARTLGGSRLENDALIRLAIDEFTGRRIFIVRQWMLLDVIAPDAHEQQIKKNGLIPTVLYADQIVYASDASIAINKRFITGYQKSFEACFFESKDTLYILAGRGCRKHVSLPALIALQKIMEGAHHD
jgi:hypothetical protein